MRVWHRGPKNAGGCCRALCVCRMSVVYCVLCATTYDSGTVVEVGGDEMTQTKGRNLDWQSSRGSWTGDCCCQRCLELPKRANFDHLPRLFAVSLEYVLLPLSVYCMSVVYVCVVAVMTERGYPCHPNRSSGNDFHYT